jgi:hypothetical protein
VRVGEGPDPDLILEKGIAEKEEMMKMKKEREEEILFLLGTGLP